MNYITNAEFLVELARWERKLPHFDAFAGVPRSGIWPAAWLAMRRNVKLLDLTQLRSGDVPEGVQSVLLVDDNAGEQANTLTKAMASIKPSGRTISCGVVYCSFRQTPVDYYSAFRFPGPVFEYDWHRRHYVKHAGFDMDGVLCDDYTGYERQDPAGYLNFLENVKPLFKPRDQVKAIVTARLEKYRDVTVDWLARHGVKYGALHMYPGTDVDRHVDATFWMLKAEYLSRKDVWFFVESCPSQSQQIAAVAKKPVICPGHGIYGVRK